MVVRAGTGTAAAEVLQTEQTLCNHRITRIMGSVSRPGPPAGATLRHSRAVA
jgi:hypothetical protein